MDEPGEILPQYPSLRLLFPPDSFLRTLTRILVIEPAHLPNKLLSFSTSSYTNNGSFLSAVIMNRIDSGSSATMHQRLQWPHDSGTVLILERLNPNPVVTSPSEDIGTTNNVLLHSVRLQSLNSLSRNLSKLGQTEAALDASREEVALRRQLAAQNPLAFNVGLANALQSLSYDLSKLRHK
jgi:hypothetical protein